MKFRHDRNSKELSPEHRTGAVSRVAFSQLNEDELHARARNIASRNKQLQARVDKLQRQIDAIVQEECVSLSKESEQFVNQTVSKGPHTNHT